jgi:ubiquinone/menaquinone biosynthesis C-methylase UbiE
MESFLKEGYLDDRQVGRYWEQNAETWTKLARMGMDVTRDHVNTPAFLSILPDITGLRGLDIGCGEGHNTRILASLGARMTGIDISKTFISHAHKKESEKPLGIHYEIANAVELHFPDNSFEFAASFMALMDMAEPQGAISEAQRVIKPGGFFQFSIIHPCFGSPPSKWIDDEKGRHIARQCWDYFKEGFLTIEKWIFYKTPPELKARLGKFQVPRFHFTLASWMNMLIEAEFVIEHLHEPSASDEVLERLPEFADTRVIAEYLIVRCRKPQG